MAEKKLWIVKKFDRDKGTLYVKSSVFRCLRWTSDRNKAKRFSSLISIFSIIPKTSTKIDIERIYDED